MSTENVPTTKETTKKALLSKEFLLYLFINLFGYMGLAIANAGITWYIEKTSPSTENAFLVSLFLALSILFSFVGLILFNKFLSNKNLFKVLKGACLVQLFTMLAATLYATLVDRILGPGTMGQTPFMLVFIVGLALVNAPAIYIFQIVGRGIIDTNYMHISRATGNSVIELGTQIAGIIGAVALGALYTTLGVKTFVVVVFSMVIAVALILVAEHTTDTNVSQTQAAKDSEKNEQIGTKKTVQFFSKHISILIFGVLVWAPTIIVAITNTAFPPYVDHVLVDIHFPGLGAVTTLPPDAEAWSTVIFSASQVAYGIGGILASLIAGLMLKKAKLSIPALCVLFILTLVLFIFFPGTKVFLFSTCLMAFAIVFLRIYLNTSLMELVPKHMYTSILFFLTAVGTLIQGGFTLLCGFLAQNDTVYDSFFVSIAIIAVAWIVTSSIGTKHDLLSKISKAGD